MTFLSAGEGGRKTPAHQGYRSDLGFDGDPYTYTIHLEFLRDDGSPYQLNEPVPAAVRANMYVLFPETQLNLRDLVHVGQKVRVLEGNRTVAIGEISAIKNLPMALTETARVALTFYSYARPFVQWAKSAANENTQTVDPLELHELLARLQAAAAALPPIGPSDEVNSADTAEQAVVDFGSKLPLDVYTVVFNPLDENDREPVFGSLKNDIGDICADVGRGMTLCEREFYEDAIWHWRFSYYSHWGRHLASAQMVLWQYLSEAWG
jgi:hypothetical protein